MNQYSSKTKFSFRQALFCALPLLFLSLASVSRAGLTFTLDLYVSGGTYVFYTPVTTNALGAAAPLGSYVISSPTQPTNGSWRQFLYDANGFNTVSGGENGYGSLAAALQQITNGLWSLLVTNATSTNLYKFTVSLPGGLTTNQLPITLVTFPLDGSTGVTNQPLFTWTGPTNWPVSPIAHVAESDQNYNTLFFLEATLSPSQHSWAIPMTIPAGDASFNVNYVTNYVGNLFVASMPTNTSNGQPLSGWAYNSTLESGQYASFNVSPPPASSSGHQLIAHYTFDNSGDLGHDSSANHNNIQCSSSWGANTIHQFTADAKAGGGAVQFFGESSLTPCGNSAPLSSWTNALAGSFTVSTWIKTTTSVGFDTDGLDDGTGQTVIYLNNSYNNGVIPLGITGHKAAFFTGAPQPAYSGATLRSSNNVTSGSYVQLVVTRDQGSGLKQIYVNGVLDGAGYGEPGSLGGSIDYASIGGEAGAPYFGKLDDVQIYAGVLNPSEIASLYGAPGSTAPDGGGASLGTALNATNQIWSTSGDTSWFVESTVTHDGSLAVQSGAVTNNQTSTLQTTVVGPGTVTFWWQSAASGGGYEVDFYDNGNNLDSLSGNNSWTMGTYSIPAGTNVLTWTAYAFGDNDTTEASYLDQFTFTPQAPLPVITVNPFNQTNYPGYSVALLAAATGSPTPSFQWFKIGVGAIPGATNGLFIPTNSGFSTVAGSYYAVASNSGGSVNTTTAAVSFVSVPLTADWSAAFKSPFTNNNNLGSDFYLACFADASGNLFAAGQFAGTNTIGPKSYTSAFDKSSAVLVKQDSLGTPIWAVAVTNNGNGSSFSQLVVPAPGGGAYFAGNYFGTNWLGTNRLADTGGAAIFLSRFDASGNLLWLRTISNPTNFVFCSYNNLQADAAGNVMISGLIQGATAFTTTNGAIGTNLVASGQQGMLARYDANGAFQWAEITPGWLNNFTYINGRIYGSLGVPSTNFNFGAVNLVTDRAYALVAVNATNGQAIWMRGIGEPYGVGNPLGNILDVPMVSASGSNVFAVGISYTNGAAFGPYAISWSGSNGQYFARCDTNGNPQVLTSFGSPSTLLWAIQADASGSNVYVGGDFDIYSAFGSALLAAPHLDSIGNGYLSDGFVAKLDRNGNSLWSRPALTQKNLVNVRGLTLAPDGVWVCGFLKSPGNFGTNVVASAFACLGTPTCTLSNLTSGFFAKVTDSTNAGPVTLINMQVSGANFQFQFITKAGHTYPVLVRTNITLGNWVTNTTITGDGTLKTFSIPKTSPRESYFRVLTL